MDDDLPMFAIVAIGALQSWVHKFPVVGLVMQMAQLRSREPLSRAVIWAICTDKSAPAQSQLELAKPCFKLTKFQSCYIISNLLKTL